MAHFRELPEDQGGTCITCMLIGRLSLWHDTSYKSEH